MTTIRRMQTLLAAAVASSDSFEVAMKCSPGRARCGDFGDVVHLDESRCCALVVDGGGHGITGVAQACAIRAAVRVALAASEEALMEPSAVFNAVNRLVAESGGRQVLPCTYIGIDVSAGKAAYINAGGMPPLLLVGPGRLVTLDQPSLVLGVDTGHVYRTTRVDLPEAFRVVCHTDGLIEATSAAGESLGEQRLHEALLERSAFASASDLLATIHQTWKRHLSGTQADDDALTLVIGRG